MMNKRGIVWVPYIAAILPPGQERCRGEIGRGRAHFRPCINPLSGTPWKQGAACYLSRLLHRDWETQVKL